MKKLLVLWIIIAVFAFGGLTYLGLNIKNQNKPYNELEEKLEKQAVSLFGANPNLISGGNKITIDDLNNNGYSVDPVVNGDKCDGYVLVEKSMSFYKYTAYIKCNKYTTHGYK